MMMMKEEMACPHCRAQWRARVPNPLRCPRCWLPLRRVSRGANSGGAGVGGESPCSEGNAGGGHLDGLAVSFLQKTEKPSERLREVSAVRDQLVGGNGSDAEPAREACPYREYDSEAGEWYACGLRVHGPKVKHTRGAMVEA